MIGRSAAAALGCVQSCELDAHLRELTEREIREAIDDDVSEADEALRRCLPRLGQQRTR